MEKKQEERKNLKRDNFRRVAQRRVREICEKLRLLGNLSHTGNYISREEQIDKIFNYLEFELNKARKRFQKKKIFFSFDTPINMQEQVNGKIDM